MAPVRRLGALGAAVVLVVAMAMPGAAVAGKKGHTYEPPYKNGPAGGDRWNHVERDPESGQMGVFRVFPGFSPVVGCVPEPSGGWGMFHVKHEVKDPVSKVTVTFETALDPYAWVTVGARNARGDWLGVKKFQGPFAGDDKLTAQLFDKPRVGDTITLEFGLQVGDSCPQVSAAVASFPSIEVR